MLAHRHLERQFDPPEAAPPPRLPLRRFSQTFFACRKSSASTSSFEAWRSRSFGLQHRDPWPEDIQRRCRPLQAAVRGRARPPRRSRTTRSRAISRRSSRPETGLCGWRASTFRTAIPPGSEKYPYKLAFLERLIIHARQLLEYEEPLVLAGDFNVIPDAARRHATLRIGSTTLCSCPQTRLQVPRACGRFGLIDALRATTDAAGLYSFWDYPAGAWQKNNGIRIDHLLLSPAGRRPAAIGHDRQGHARARQGVRPYAGSGRAGTV